MSYKIIIDDISDDLWEQYAKQFADYNFYQTAGYQRIRAETDGQDLSRAVVLDDAQEVVTMCHMRIKNVRPLGLRIGYVQWGPLLRRFDGATKCSSEAMRELFDSYLVHRINVLRVAPNVCDDDYGRQIRQMLESAGFNFVSNVKPYLTMMIRLDGSEDEIRGRLHRSWRRGLKKAEASNIEIQQDSGREFLAVLENIYVTAKSRKGFAGLDPREFIRAQELLSDAEKMNVITAIFDGEPLTAHSSSHLGDTAVGILAGSTEKGLELGSSYMVWWHTLIAAKRTGMLRYDLGGIDPVNNPDVHQFKLRMGAEQVRHIGVFDFCTGVVTKILWRAVGHVYHIIIRKH